MVRRRTRGSSLLAPVGALYGLCTRLRARRWRGRGRRLPHPVLSIGNLTFGGTGKTPLVIHACEELQRRGKRPGILSRGYRSRGPEGNDEAQVLRRHLPAVPHVEDPDRYRGGLALAERVDCYVLDDGFQHLPLHRDADVVLVDATDPFGGGWCPPAGRLREPPAALRRASLVVITRADLVSRESLGETMRVVRAHSAAPIAAAVFRPSCDADLEGVEALLACGIGNPHAFLATAERLGVSARERRFFRDHHHFTARDAAELARAGLPVVVTEKDAVKLEPLWTGEVPLHVVRIDAEIVEGRSEWEGVLAALHASGPAG